MKFLSSMGRLVPIVVLCCSIVGCGDGSKAEPVVSEKGEVDGVVAHKKEKVVKTTVEKSTRQESPKATGNRALFKLVDLDDFIAKEKASSGEFKGKKVIKMAAPVRFSAKIKRYPEEKKMSYVYTALEMAQVSPMPEVSHQLFVESNDGEVISVYVEKFAAARIKKHMKINEEAEFMGYHAYNYSRGPAVVVTDLIPASLQAAKE